MPFISSHHSIVQFTLKEIIHLKDRNEKRREENINFCNIFDKYEICVKKDTLFIYDTRNKYIFNNKK